MRRRATVLGNTVALGRRYGRLVYLVEVRWFSRLRSRHAKRCSTRPPRLFYAHGIAATGIDAITDEAGVARKSLYNNFASKDELVLAYIEARHQEWLGLYRAGRAASPQTPRPVCWRCSTPTSTMPSSATSTGSAAAGC